MLALAILATLASGGGSAAQLKPALTLAKNSDSSGRFEIREGKEDDSWLAKRFRESLWQNNAVLRELNGQSPRTLEEYLRSTDYSTVKQTLALRGSWKSGNAMHTWVFDEPDRPGGEVLRALELEDLSGPVGYNVRATLHCYDEPDFCKPFRYRHTGLLAPKPVVSAGDLALRQWHNRVQNEPCNVRAKNMQQPRYPSNALRDGVQGSVMVGILFNTCGNVRDSWIHQSSGSLELDRAAVTNALKWQIDMQSLPKTLIDPRRASVPVRFMLGDEPASGE